LRRSIANPTANQIVVTRPSISVELSVSTVPTVTDGLMISQHLASEPMPAGSAKLGRSNRPAGQLGGKRFGVRREQLAELGGAEGSL
jgi:hypothetical protein